MPAMTLRDLVEKYLAAAGSYGKTVALTSLGLSREETERAMSLFDEDYHISRYFHFQRVAGATYAISGFPQTHVSIDAEIQSIL
jgi:N-formylglutamate amidohydrolase